MSDFNVSSQDRNHTLSILERLSVSLDCSVEDFLDPHLSEQGQAVEFLRLWQSIENDQDRAKVLAFIRGMIVNAVPSGEPSSLTHAMHQRE